MAEGTSTFEGLSLPRLGEYEQVQQTAATDMVTLTGASSMSGDFFVCQDSSGNEVFVVASDGAFALGMNSTAGTAALDVTLGAAAQADAVIEYTAGAAADTTSFFRASGSLAPTYLFSVGASAPDAGAAGDNGFFVGATTLRTTAAVSSDTEWAYAQIQNGSKVFNLLAYPATGME